MAILKTMTKIPASDPALRYDPTLRAAQSKAAELETQLIKVVAASKALLFALENASGGWNSLYKVIFHQEISLLHETIEDAELELRPVYPGTNSPPLETPK
jgi:hypothetical protein